MDESGLAPGHVFVSYVREDSRNVDQLHHMLQSAGIPVWRDTTELWPGEDWGVKIREAIRTNAFVFIGCFSRQSIGRASSYQNEELSLAINEMRKRPATDHWLMPVRFDDCDIPDLDIGSGRTLRSLHRADLFGLHAPDNADRLIAAVRRIVDHHRDNSGTTADRPEPGRSRGWHMPSVSARRLTSPAPTDEEPTFGILTAFPEEFTAVSAMTDGPRSVGTTGEEANRILGTMPSLDPNQPHRIALTLLGDPGKDGAATCAETLGRFTSIRCMLMIGIAIGIPNLTSPERHVRRGDLVIARHGIAEYVGALDPAGTPGLRHIRSAAPMLERRARMLSAGDPMAQRPWENLIVAAARALPEFCRPPEDTDVLYVGDEPPYRAQHPDTALTGHRPGRPKVHLGMIASGDSPIYNARQRDWIAAAEPEVMAIDAACVAAVAASIPEQIEFLVISAVSGYGDHQYDAAWCNYASLVAAAFARALLAECPPLIPERREAQWSRTGSSQLTGLSSEALTSDSPGATDSPHVADGPHRRRGTVDIADAGVVAVFGNVTLRGKYVAAHDMHIDAPDHDSQDG
jgi:nucleoside phosphorylase